MASRRTSAYLGESRLDLAQMVSLRLIAEQLLYYSPRYQYPSQLLARGLYVPGGEEVRLMPARDFVRVGGGGQLRVVSARRPVARVA